jgi:hypothetical protein
MKESDDVKQKSDSQMFGVDPTIWWENQQEKTCPIIHKGELAKTDMPACMSIQDLRTPKWEKRLAAATFQIPPDQIAAAAAAAAT